MTSPGGLFTFHKQLIVIMEICHVSSLDIGSNLIDSRRPACQEVTHIFSKSIEEVLLHLCSDQNIIFKHRCAT